MSNKNIYFTKDYDDKMLEISFFKKYPHMIPFIGKDFDSYKILILAESYYLPEYSSIHHNDDWYEESIKSLKNEEINWSSPIQIINDDFLHWDKLVSGHTIYNSLKIALEDVIKNQNVFENIAFYNFFQRPAIYTESLNVTKKDSEIANEVFKQVISILNPNIIYFVSKKAHDHLKLKDLNPDIQNKIIYTPHPATAWWNKKMKSYGNKTGKEIFKEGLSRVIK